MQTMCLIHSGIIKGLRISEVSLKRYGHMGSWSHGADGAGIVSGCNVGQKKPLLGKINFLFRLFFV